MQVEKNTSFSQKVMKKAIQLSVGSTLLEWPPFCLTFDYQPHRPEKPLPKPQDKK